MTIIGIMREVYDPESLAELEQHPDGMISCSGSAEIGQYKTIAVVQMRIVLGEHDLRCFLSAEKAQELRQAISDATSDAFRLAIEEEAQELEAVTVRDVETDVVK